MCDEGELRTLPRSGGWYLERRIPGSTLYDGMGGYPLFCCADWGGLAADIADLTGRIVCLSLVTDPFGTFSEADLRRTFDFVTPYKLHFVTDLETTGGLRLGRVHRRNTRRAVNNVELDTCHEPLTMLDEWCALYEHLAAKHAIAGVRSFSRESFRRQLSVPGLMMFRASAGGQTVGLHLWYVQRDVAYGHLGATSPLGYSLMASYALYGYAVDQLRSRVRWMSLGASPGAAASPATEGLTRFKAGWSTGVRQTYFCGSVLQPLEYARLIEGMSTATRYFPAYRERDFAPAV